MMWMAPVGSIAGSPCRNPKVPCSHRSWSWIVGLWDGYMCVPDSPRCTCCISKNAPRYVFAYNVWMDLMCMHMCTYMYVYLCMHGNSRHIIVSRFIQLPHYLCYLFVGSSGKVNLGVTSKESTIISPKHTHTNPHFQHGQ